MPDLLASRPARLTVCRCGAATVSALVEGVPSVADAVPCTVIGELIARRAGRESFELAKNGELLFRDLSRITARRKTGPILVTHKCGYPIPIEYRAPVILAPRPEENHNDRPPF